ncbi:MAG: tRNA (adenosine(37)-N6)-threonylcarbamoyltransferase complex dimerization subunit type 1 TsaB [Oceanospirillales bacterium]|nr:MAG: tRNA (adenosine(37)-N6)-threonylcarbamoyltransferase complex dimerization subunit type 1 TsaB [Oceanospirillales bacterium]
MMRLLALDTSSDACSVALMLGDEVIEDFRIEPRRHTHLLLPMVEQILADAGVTLSSLDAIAFGRGPGSFAGIRIATGAAQGLAMAVDLPLIPVSTLSALANSELKKSPDAQVLAILDARMDEVYWSVCEATDQGVGLLQPEQVGAPDTVTIISSTKPLIAVGTGLVYLDRFPEVTRSSIQSSDVKCYPRASEMLTLAAIELQQGRVFSPEKAQPVYLRDQVAWKKKDQQ